MICRLGHREQKDEWSPRRVDVFTRHNVLPPNALVSAGSVNSSCTAGMVLLLLWFSFQLLLDEKICLPLVSFTNIVATAICCAACFTSRLKIMIVI